MLIDIKELRDSTGMTQKEFASRYGIPISTLRKWEQGESSPAPYVAALLARTLPDTESSLKRIKTRGGKTYYYNPAKKRSLRCERKPHHDSGRFGRCERAESCVVSGRFV